MFTFCLFVHLFICVREERSELISRLGEAERGNICARREKYFVCWQGLLPVWGVKSPRNRVFVHTREEEEGKKKEGPNVCTGSVASRKTKRRHNGLWMQRWQSAFTLSLSFSLYCAQLHCMSGPLLFFDVVVLVVVSGESFTISFGPCNHGSRCTSECSVLWSMCLFGKHSTTLCV